MGLLFTLLLFTQIRVGRLLHLQLFLSSLLFCCSFHIIDLVQPYFIENCFLLISLRNVQLRLSFEDNRMLQICMISLSFKVFCPKQKEIFMLSREQVPFALEFQNRQQFPFVNTSLVLSYCLFVCSQILPSHPGSKILHGKDSQLLSSQGEGPHCYDSGNDTSSPPSCNTGVSQASITDNKRNEWKHLASPEKLKFTERDNASDSGNSVTSYASLCKSYGEDSFSTTLFSGKGRR